jgi:hypothetical protein
MNVVRLCAESTRRKIGRQRIARVTGLDQDGNLQTCKIGQVIDKKGYYTTAEISEPGLYMVRDLPKRGSPYKGYCLVTLSKRGDLQQEWLDSDTALCLARSIRDGKLTNLVGCDVGNRCQCECPGVHWCRLSVRGRRFEESGEQKNDHSCESACHPE